MPFVSAQAISLSFDEVQAIGERIFENECSGKNECLLSWNEGEDFLSLGIGHFIWYPSGKEGPFDETFPQLLGYIRAGGKPLPDWLSVDPPPDCPWSSRADFMRERHGPQAVELRRFLMATKAEQAAFLIERFKLALPMMLAQVPQDKHSIITKHFQQLTSTPAGVFALIDYINFKGLGVVESERYQGQGWGLLQVLSAMPPDSKELDSLKEFVQASENILKMRVNNAPPERNEQRWLAGWLNRIHSYQDVLIFEQ